MPGRLVFRIDSLAGQSEVELILANLLAKIDKIEDPERQTKERVVYNRVASAYRSAREFLKKQGEKSEESKKRAYQGKQPLPAKTKPISVTQNKR